MTDQPPPPDEPGSQQPGQQQPWPQQPGPQNQPWPQQPWPAGYAPPPPTHPQATTVLVLGILGIVVCQVVGPFAWTMGNRVMAEIDAAAGRLGGRTEATVGRVLGIVATALLGLTVVVFGLFIVVNVAMLAGFAGFTSHHDP